jgi:hypothetical protein
MKIKNSSDDLIKRSKTIQADIIREVMDSFGIDISSKELVHHDKTKPVWTQQILDNKSLKHELDSFLSIVENNVKRLPEMIQFEKDHVLYELSNHSQDSISYDLEFLWICESHVKKFEKERYLSEKEIIKYNVKLQLLRDTIKNMMVEQSL